MQPPEWCNTPEMWRASFCTLPAALNSLEGLAHGAVPLNHLQPGCCYMYAPPGALDHDRWGSLSSAREGVKRRTIYTEPLRRCVAAVKKPPERVAECVDDHDVLCSVPLALPR